MFSIILIAQYENDAEHGVGQWSEGRTWCGSTSRGQNPQHHSSVCALWMHRVQDMTSFSHLMALGNYPNLLTWSVHDEGSIGPTILPFSSPFGNSHLLSWDAAMLTKYLNWHQWMSTAHNWTQPKNPASGLRPNNGYTPCLLRTGYAIPRPLALVEIQSYRGIQVVWMISEWVFDCSKHRGQPCTHNFRSQIGLATGPIWERRRRISKNIVFSYHHMVYYVSLVIVQ